MQNRSSSFGDIKLRNCQKNNKRNKSTTRCQATDVAFVSVESKSLKLPSTKKPGGLNTVKF